MHEFTIATELVATALREAEQRGARRIERVECRVGAMRQVVPSMLVDAFAVAAAGTPAENAALEVVVVAPIITCRACGARSEPREWVCECPQCRSIQIRIEGGDELLLASLTLEVDDGR